MFMNIVKEKHIFLKGFVPQSSATFETRVVGNKNPEGLDEGALQNQIQCKLEQEKFERGDDMFASTNVNVHHDQYSYQSHENSHTNSYTGTLNSAHSQQHSPHASACSGTGSGSNAAVTARYVTPTPPGHPQQSDYESSYHSSSMNSSQHSGQAQNPFPHGNQIIVQDPIKPELLK